MNLEELEARVNASPALRNLRDQCMSEMSQRVDNNSSQFGIILILSIISVVIQIATYCRNKNKSELISEIRNIRSLPHWRLLRLKRQMNTLWRKEFPDKPITAQTPNPMLAATYALGETADETALRELLALADVPD